MNGGEIRYFSKSCISHILSNKVIPFINILEIDLKIKLLICVKIKNKPDPMKLSHSPSHFLLQMPPIRSSPQ